MHTVCDEHSSHSFKSDGWPAHRPRVQEVISDQQKKYQQTELWGHQHVNAQGLLHAHRVGTVHTACLALSNQADDAEVVLRIEKRVRQGLLSLMAENGNACTTYAYHGPTPGFSEKKCCLLESKWKMKYDLLASLICFIMVSVSGMRSTPFKCEWCSLELEQRVVCTMHMCTFDAQLKSASACYSILVSNTCIKRIFLRCLYRSKYKQPMMMPVQMDYWWSLKQRGLITRTAFLYASCICELGICMRLNSIV